MKTAHFHGVNRGFRGYLPFIPESFTTHAECQLIDPKPHHLTRAATLTRERFPTLPVTTFAEPSLEAVLRLNAGDHLSLSVDTPGDMAASLAALPHENLTVSTQVLGRGGQDHQMFGLLGVTESWEQKERRMMTRLLETCAEFAPTTSSSQFRDNGLGQLITRPFRDLVGRRHGQALGDLGKDPQDKTHAPLMISFGQQMSPLLLTEPNEQLSRKEMQAHALDLVTPIPTNHQPTPRAGIRTAVVGFIRSTAPEVTFLTVERTRNDRRRAVKTVVLKPAPSPKPIQSTSPSTSTRFGDFSWGDVIGAFFTD